MIRGLLDGFRQGRDQALAGYGLRRPDAAPAADDHADYTEEPQHRPQRIVELEGALRASDAECAETKRLLADVTEYAEQLQARVTELEAERTPLVQTFRLPGVKAMLVNRFHPEKYPKADAETLRNFTEALKIINAAYAVVQSDGGRDSDASA